MSTIAIIGTAGRGEDGRKLDYRSFPLMRRAVFSVLTRRDHTLISGGAGWADHLAVNLYITGNCANLILALPCLFDLDKCQFQDNGARNYEINPGRTANAYHEFFTSTSGIDSLAEIKEAIEGGAKVEIGKGFKDRNSIVAAKANGVIALTFGAGPKVKDGGTWDCCSKYLARGGKHLVHIDLNQLLALDEQSDEADIKACIYKGRL